MKAKTINENIKKVLKPKTQEEIEEVFNKLEPDEMARQGISYDKPEIVKKAIDRGAKLHYHVLDDFLEFNEPKWINVFYYYLDACRQGKGYKEAYALHLALKLRNTNLIKDIVENDKINFSEEFKENTRAHIVIRNAIRYNNSLDLIQWLYNHKKINNFINRKHDLLVSLIEQYPEFNEQFLDKLLKE